MAKAGMLGGDRVDDDTSAARLVRNDREFLDAIIQATPECIKIVAPDGAVVQMNPAGLRMVGAASWNAVAGACVFDLIAPEHRDEWRWRHERVCGGESLTWEFDLIGLDGARRHMHTHAAPIGLADGSVGQLAITRDITEPKRLDRELKRQAASQRELLEALPTAIYTTDPDGRITYFNEAAVQLAGRRPELGEIWGAGWELYTPDGAALPHDQSPMATALRERRRVRGAEAIAVQPDGTRIPFMPFPTPLFNETGELTGGVNVLVDISDRKAAETALQKLNDVLEEKVSERTRELEAAVTRLKESERNFGLLVGGVIDYAIYMLDPSGHVASWNAGAERIKGYDEQEIIGRHFSHFYTEEDREAGLPARGLDAAFREGRFEAEGWRVRKDGSRFWASVVIDAIRERGKLIGFAKVTRDITERKAAEAQLHQAQKMEAVGQLTGGVAHDFNNLLAAIIPSLEMARSRVQDERALKHLDTASHAAARGAALTHQLLAFSRKQHLASRVIDINQQIEQLCEMLPRTLGPMILVERDLKASWLAMTDPSQLEGALLNLAINARDAMNGRGELRISTRNVELSAGRRTHGLDPGAYVRVSVADTGPGMSEDVRGKAFEPFFTTKPTGQGSGLGLSMVYGFARQSRGAAVIDSAPGLGARIDIYLPRTTGVAGAATQQNCDGALVAGPPSRILVVDDDDSVRAVTAELVRSFGHEVTAAGSGAAALDLLRSDSNFDLMIVDLAMPDMHGALFAGCARAIAQIPALFVTGYSETDWPSDVVGDQLLRKPFDTGQLAQKLDEMLKAAVG
jgi:PAS domain S-box-containing protein